GKYQPTRGVLQVTTTKPLTITFGYLRQAGVAARRLSRIEWPHLRRGLRAAHRSQLSERERAVPTRGNEEVLPVGCAQHGVEALVATAGPERQAGAARQHAVHRETIAAEVVACRIEDDEVETGSRRILHPVPLRACAPRKRVVEGVEIGSLGHRRPPLVHGSVVGDDVTFEPRGRLDRGAVTDPAVTTEATTYGGRRRSLSRSLRDRHDTGLHLEARLEGGIDPFLEVEGLIPGGEVLEDVREMHVRPVEEIAIRTEIHVAECLEVRDPARAERSLLGRRETEE